MSNTIDNSSIKSKQWVLASNNQGKLKEFQHLFSHNDLDVELIPQAQLNIDDAVEDGLSFIENALIKARHASRISGLPAIADDSGLCVPVLGNAPGIYSARYAGEIDKSKRDNANNQKIMDTLAPIRYRLQQEGKEARIKGEFVCVLAMVRHADDPLPIIAQGIWHGEMLAEPVGGNGFGYDPLFWLPQLNKASAELSKEEKSQLSHRGIASRILLENIKAELEV